MKLNISKYKLNIDKIDISKKRKIEWFRWENALLRSGHEYDCHVSTVPNSISISSHEATDRLDEALYTLSQLRDHWDGDGAPAPSDLAVSTGRSIIEQLHNELSVSDVEADAMGGIVLWLNLVGENQQSSRWAWFECRNSGRALLVLDDRSTETPPKVILVENLAPAFEAAADFLLRGKT
jgi:hypothetical protein